MASPKGSMGRDIVTLLVLVVAWFVGTGALLCLSVPPKHTVQEAGQIVALATTLKVSVMPFRGHDICAMEYWVPRPAEDHSMRYLVPGEVQEGVGKGEGKAGGVIAEEVLFPCDSGSLSYTVEETEECGAWLTWTFLSDRFLGVDITGGTPTNEAKCSVCMDGMKSGGKGMAEANCLAHMMPAEAVGVDEDVSFRVRYAFAVRGMKVIPPKDGDG